MSRAAARPVGVASVVLASFFTLLVLVSMPSNAHAADPLLVTPQAGGNDAHFQFLESVDETSLILAGQQASFTAGSLPSGNARTVDPLSVTGPEPATLALLAGAALPFGAIVMRRRRRGA